MIDLKSVEHIHCIGIGGVGLSAVAFILLDRGLKITGSDMNQNDKTERLIKKGAGIFLGHREKNIEGADLVIYSSAVGRDNPELVAAREKGIPTVSRAEMLGCIMEDCTNSVAVAGTHGKTTTTSMLSLILKDAGLDPTVLVGGNLQEIGGNVRTGGNEYFVTEACEYMDSFLKLKPTTEIILNIDSDHLDYFKDIEHIVQSFEKFASLVPEDGTLYAYDANPFVNRVIKDMPNVITFGFNASSTYNAQDVVFDNKGRPTFDIYTKGKKLCTVQLKIPGEHNILNALVATACAHRMGVAPETIVSTLQKFKGTKRRFDEVGTTQSGIRIVDDYAHHPTEIKATLAAASKMKKEKTWVVFQPHTYTRTMALFDEFAGAFSKADVVVLAEIFAAREKNVYKISSKALRDRIKEKQSDKEVYYFPSFEEIARFVYNNAGQGDLVITMGAGDVYSVGDMILELDGETYAGRGEKIND